MTRLRLLPKLVACGWVSLAASLLCAESAWASTPAAAPPLESLSALTVSSYLGTWYQVAYFPNRFQSQCISDTTATYQLESDGSLRVLNRCKTADGRFDEALGRARPVGRVENDQLSPARLRVSFLPAWLQWLPVGQGDYWVIQRADDGRYAVISEPTRQYLWVLSRTPALSADDESAIRSRLQVQGFDLARWAAHPHGAR